MSHIKMKIEPTNNCEQLHEATNKTAYSWALDQAARYYLQMCDDMAAYGRNNIQTLLDAVGQEVDLTPLAIAGIPDEQEIGCALRNP
jgi:hypothetical protein